MGEVLDKLVDRLTDNFNKNKGGNIYKLMSVAALSIQENEDLLNKISAWRDIDQAQGDVLNKIGANVQQERGKTSDDVYRVLIKSKVKRNLSSGSINTLIDFVSFILQISPKDVTITEEWTTGGNNATIHVDAPADAVNATGLSLAQFGRLINLVVAAGVKANVLLEGTFAFSDTYNASTLNDANGFADDALTTGGTFGYIYDPANDVELPI